MSIIAEYRLPVDDFVFDPGADPGVGIELDRWVSDADAVVCYFWVPAGGYDAFETAVAAASTVDGVEAVDEVGSRRLYRGQCLPEAGTLVEALRRFDGSVVDAETDDHGWRLRIEFGDSEALSDFQSYCVDAVGAAIELGCLYEDVASTPEVGSELTARQRETLVTAYEQGYFDIPRKITLVDLAEDLDVSDQAISERLRRGKSKLIRANLIDD